MSHSHRAPSPYRSPPGVGALPIGAGLPTGPATVGPGSVTYATEAGPDGSIIYQPYRAVAASYHTPAGLVSGIQWVKADPESLVKQGIDPVEWNAKVQSEAWQRGEDERRRRDKDTSRRQHRDATLADARTTRDRDRDRDDDYDELRRAREWDAQSMGGGATAKRDRRKSFNAGPAAQPNHPGVAFPSDPSQGGGYGGYPAHPNAAGGAGGAIGTPYPPFGQGGYNGAPVAYAASAGSSHGHGHGRHASTSSAYDLAQRMGDLNLDRGKKDYERERKTSQRTRTVSGNYGAGAGNAYPTPPGAYPGSSSYSAMGPPAGPPGNPYPASTSQYAHAPSPYMRPGEMGHSSNAYPSNAYTTSPRVRAGDITGYGTSSPHTTHTSGYPGASVHPGASPSQHPASSIGRSTTPYGSPPQVYPRGHVLEGQPVPPGVPTPVMSHAPMPRSRAHSRAASPNPGYRQQIPSASGRSPHIPASHIPGMPGEPPQQLPAPEAFSRPLNMANSFMPFELTKVRDMEDIYDAKLPKMPSTLATHDIYPEDWQRCMQDLGRAWSGQLPVPSMGPALPRRSILAADLVDLWNDKFFFLRGVELRLYKGKQKRTGKNAGVVEKHLPGYDDDHNNPTSSSSESSSSGASSDAEFARRNPYGVARDLAAEKEEKRRRRKERRAKRKAKSYAVYVACLPRPAAPYGPMPGGYPVAPAAAAPAGYGYGAAPAPGVVPMAMGYGANPSYASSTGYPAGYGVGGGVPASRSQGYGGGY